MAHQSDACSINPGLLHQPITNNAEINLQIRTSGVVNARRVGVRAMAKELSMTKHSFRMTLAVTFLIASVMSAAETTGEQPNIVVILTDDI